MHDKHFADWERNYEPPPIYRDHFRLTVSIISVVAVVLLFNFFSFTERGHHFDGRKRVPSDLRATYSLSRLTILTKCVSYIRNHYVDPTRVDPRQMIVAALKAVESKVGEVLAEVKMAHGRPTRILLTVGKASRRFSLHNVSDLYEMNWKFVSIFEFISQNLSYSVDLKQIEYIAVNGLLSTLDPHSTLLPPETYHEIRRGTEGSFGGLGVVIAIEENQLSVVRVMPDTPASRSGLQRSDRIVQIGARSTVNMSLKEAATRLQGSPGTVISLWIARKGWKKPLKVSITRAQISVPSVVTKRLAGDVLHVELKRFQSNSADELTTALRDAMTKRPLAGVVLDLRDNPGGLLDQAVKIADLFLAEGMIVKTVMHSNYTQETRNAERGQIGEKIPMVVLINRSSASASEIVAGALKYNNRALLMGQRTFGKNTVQVLYEIDESDQSKTNSRTAGLKLTIRKYLLAHEHSIGGVGIAPDIRLVPIEIERNRISLFAAAMHLSEGTGIPNPIFVLKYLDPQPAGEPVTADRSLEIARKIVLRATTSTRSDLLARVNDMVGDFRLEEEQKIASKIADLGVDWRDGPADHTKLRVDVRVEGRERITPGKPMYLVARVKNVGKSDVHRVYGLTNSSHTRLQDLEFLFGRLKPGETRSWRVPITLPSADPTRVDELNLTIYGAKGVLMRQLTHVRVRGLKRPKLAFMCQLVDPEGNGDGLPQPGERLGVHCTLRNLGKGATQDTVISLINRTGDSVHIHKGRVEVAPLAPGQKIDATFTFDLQKSVVEQSLKLGIAVTDYTFRTRINDTLEVPIFPVSSIRVVPTHANLRVMARFAEIHAGAHASRRIVGRIANGAVVRCNGRLGNWYRIMLDRYRTAWIKQHLVRVVPTQYGLPKPFPVVDEPLRGTPTIEMVGPIDHVIKGDRITISGRVRPIGPPSSIHDLYIYRNQRKVFFLLAKNHTDSDGWLHWTSTIPLDEGQNVIRIVARQDKHMTSRHTVMVYRRTAKHK